jgi:TFIIF-interacting CTD phosphatase-like protein
MKKMIIIDNIEENYIETSPFNGIKVSSWFDEMDDRVLENLGMFLK